MKCMGGAWKESKELDVRAQAFQLISIFNWKRAVWRDAERSQDENSDGQASATEHIAKSTGRGKSSVARRQQDPAAQVLTWTDDVARTAGCTLHGQPIPTARGSRALKPTASAPQLHGAHRRAFGHGRRISETNGSGVLWLVPGSSTPAAR
jgi:hypothetical protein